MNTWSRYLTSNCHGDILEHVVERFFERTANHLAEMIPNLCLINFGNFVQVPACLSQIKVLHNCVLPLIKWFFNQSVYHRPEKGLF